MLVCVAIWACGCLRSEAGKAIVIFWAIFAFISSGFEHVVANMTTFSLGLFSGDGMTTWADFVRNLVCVGFGNLVGGSLVIGASYVFVAGRASVPDPDADRADRDRADRAAVHRLDAAAAPVPVESGLR